MPAYPSAQDELLRLTGSTNNPLETVAASGNGTGAYFGSDRLFVFNLIIGGAVTGGSPTLDIKFQDSADGSTGWTDVGAAFPQQTASQAAAIGTLAALPTAAVRTRPGKPYLRIVKTVGGSTPSFGAVAVLLAADPGGVA
jgi:hypothetical protein